MILVLQNVPLWPRFSAYQWWFRFFSKCSIVTQFLSLSEMILVFQNVPLWPSFSAYKWWFWFFKMCHCDPVSQPISDDLVIQNVPLWLSLLAFQWWFWFFKMFHHVHCDPVSQPISDDFGFSKCAIVTQFLSLSVMILVLQNVPLWPSFSSYQWWFWFFKICHLGLIVWW